jgi:hypothetical protein
MAMPLPSPMAWPDCVPQTLRPYSVKEAIPIAEAASETRLSERAIRGWCARYELGRKICGRWAVSRVALAMFLDGNDDALNRYLAGDRAGVVAAYFKRLDIPILPALATSNVHPFPMRGERAR